MGQDEQRACGVRGWRQRSHKQARIENKEIEMKRISLGKEDWGFKISGKDGHLEMFIPKKHEYPFEEMTVVAVSMMRICQAIGALLDEYLKEKQPVKKFYMEK